MQLRARVPSRAVSCSALQLVEPTKGFILKVVAQAQRLGVCAERGEASDMLGVRVHVTLRSGATTSPSRSRDLTLLRVRASY